MPSTASLGELKNGKKCVLVAALQGITFANARKLPIGDRKAQKKWCQYRRINRCVTAAKTMAEEVAFFQGLLNISDEECTNISVTLDKLAKHFNDCQFTVFNERLGGKIDFMSPSELDMTKKQIWLHQTFQPGVELDHLEMISDYSVFMKRGIFQCTTCGKNLQARHRSHTCSALKNCSVCHFPYAETHWSLSKDMLPFYCFGLVYPSPSKHCESCDTIIFSTYCARNHRAVDQSSKPGAKCCARGFFVIIVSISTLPNQRKLKKKPK